MMIAMATYNIYGISAALVDTEVEKSNLCELRNVLLSLRLSDQT